MRSQSSDTFYRWRRHLALLIGGQMTSTLGNSLFLVVVVLYLVDLTDNAALVGAYHFLTTLPGFLLAPIAGLVADRVSRKAIIVGSDLARGAAMLTTGILVFSLVVEPVVVVLVATVIIGTLNALFFPAVQAIVPDIVRAPARLRSANSARGSLVQVANLTGSAVGGTVYALLGAPVVFLINGCAYLLSGFQEMFIRIAPDALSSPDRTQGGNGTRRGIRGVLDESREGMRYAFGRRNLRTIIALTFFSNLLYPPVVVALPFILRDTMHLPEIYFGYLLATTLAGGIAGYVFMAAVPLSRAHEPGLYKLSYALLAAALAGASTLTPAVMFPTLFLAGSAIAIAHVSAVTVLQRAVPVSYRGRVFAFLEMAVHLAAPLSYGLGGLFVETMRDSLFLVFPAITAGATLIAVVVACDRKLPALFISGAADGST